jgi:hypothetical protein
MPAAAAERAVEDKKRMVSSSLSLRAAEQIEACNAKDSGDGTVVVAERGSSVNEGGG